MIQLLVIGVIVMLGFLQGYFFTGIVNVVLSLLTLGSTAWLAYSSRNDGLAGIPGIILFVAAIIMNFVQWVTVAAVSGVVLSLDTSWLLRV